MHNLNRKIMVLALGGVSALAVAFCAAGVCSYTANATSSMSLKATVGSSDITITLPESEVTLDLDTYGTLVKESASVSVSTSAPYGYRILMQSNSSALTRTAKIGDDYPVIPTLESETTSIDFPINHWGLKLSSDKAFRPFDNTGFLIKSSDGPVVSDAETITFGARTDANTPAGDYELDLDLIATANFKPFDISDLDFLQDFRSLSADDKTSVITSMTKETSYTLKDYRDNQDYTISRLNDGKVWMTKNLNLAGGTTLTPEYSNVASEYTLIESYNGLQQNSLLYNSGNTTCGNSGSGIQGACYSYYSYDIATAGYNQSTGNAPSDICPAGWRLPTADEFRAFITSYPNPSSVGPFQLVYGGGYYTYSGYAFRDEGKFAYYWTSTKDGNDTANLTLLGSNGTFRVDSNTPQNRGSSIRCVLK